MKGVTYCPAYSGVPAHRVRETRCVRQRPECVGYGVNSGTAFLSGVIAGCTTPLVMLIFPLAGMSANPAVILGGLTGREPTPPIAVGGFLAYLGIAGLIAVVYAWGFERLGGRAGWRMGVAFSIVHMLAAAAILTVLPSFHPLMPESLLSPGPFFRNVRTGPAAFVALHLAYGALVGAIYGAQTTSRTWRMREPYGSPVEHR